LVPATKKQCATLNKMEIASASWLVYCWYLLDRNKAIRNKWWHQESHVQYAKTRDIGIDCSSG
jgi:hypothetical protein